MQNLYWRNNPMSEENLSTRKNVSSWTHLRRRSYPARQDVISIPGLDAPYIINHCVTSMPPNIIIEFTNLEFIINQIQGCKS